MKSAEILVKSQKLSQFRPTFFYLLSISLFYSKIRSGTSNASFTPQQYEPLMNGGVRVCVEFPKEENIWKTIVEAVDGYITVIGENGWRHRGCALFFPSPPAFLTYEIKRLPCRL